MLLGLRWRAIGQLEEETQGEREGRRVLVNMLFVSAPITVPLKRGIGTIGRWEGGEELSFPISSQEC